MMPFERADHAEKNGKCCNKGILNCAINILQFISGKRQWAPSCNYRQKRKLIFLKQNSRSKHLPNTAKAQSHVKITAHAVLLLVEGHHHVTEDMGCLFILAAFQDRLGSQEHKSSSKTGLELARKCKTGNACKSRLGKKLDLVGSWNILSSLRDSQSQKELEVLTEWQGKEQPGVEELCKNL